MPRFNDTASIQHTGNHCMAAAVRSYREVARILAAREGAPMSPAEAARMCRSAERKIAHAIRIDPIIDHWLATLQRAPMGRSSPGVNEAVRHGSSEKYGYHE